MPDGVYRDGTEGAAARRQDLLRRRRAELVTMPHAVRRVVVARAARIAAGKALALGGGALIAVAAWPGAASWLESMLPGMAPAPLTTVLTATWIIGVVAWAMSGARSQHRFAVAMSRYVLPSDDVDHDVERLDHEHPDDMARTMGHRLEVGSAAWPVVAAGAIMPATVLWLSLLVADRAYVPVSQLENAITRHAWALGLFVIAGGLGAIVMTRRAARQPLVASVLLPIGVGACGVGGFALATSMASAWIYGSAAAMIATVGVVVWRLRRERRLIDVADPAAGSELFTIRGAIRELRAGLVRVGAGVAAMRARVGRSTRTTRIAVGAVAAVIVVGGVSYPRLTHRGDVAVAQPSAAPRPIPVASIQDPLPLAQPTPTVPNLRVEARDGSLWYEVTLDESGAASVPIVGMNVLSQGWKAGLDIELLGRDHPDTVRVSVGQTSLDLGAQRILAKLTVDGCAGPQRMLIDLVAPNSGRKHLALRISPRVRVADCPLTNRE